MVFVGRVKRDIGLSFVGVLATDREARSGDSHNRVVGPDFQWRPSGADVVTGQALYSETRTPNRPDLADEWTGQSFSSHAASLQWNHSTTHLDVYAQYKDLGDGFRADTGFVPQVGYRETSGGGGWTVRPTGFVTRMRTFVNLDRQADRSGALISRDVEPGVGLDTRWNGFLQFRFIDENIRAGEQPIGRKRFGFFAQYSPSRVVTLLSIDATTGQEIDFANARPGTGSTINLQATLNPTNHLNLDLVQNQRWVNVSPVDVSQRLFIARVSRLRGTYTFTARLFARGIVQYVSTTRDPQPLHRSSHDRARRHAERAGAAVVQAELAVGHVCRLRRRSRSGGSESAGQVGASGVREGVVRVSAVTTNGDHEEQARAARNTRNAHDRANDATADR